MYELTFAQYKVSIHNKLICYWIVVHDSCKMEGKRSDRAWKDAKGARDEPGLNAAVIYNNRIKQIRAIQPTHECIMLPRLIYDYNVRV